MQKLDDLEKLAELRKKNLVTEDEYSSLKDEIISAKGTDNSPKNGVAYVLLATFLGNFGIHNFYAGYIRRAVAQLMLTLFSWVLLFLPLFAVQIWALLDMCLINKDAQGNLFVGDKMLIKLIRIAVVALVGVSYLIVLTGIVMGIMEQNAPQAVQIIRY